mgnify:CR=1 FL=1
MKNINKRKTPTNKKSRAWPKAPNFNENVFLSRRNRLLGQSDEAVLLARKRKRNRLRNAENNSIILSRKDIPSKRPMFISPTTQNAPTIEEAIKTFRNRENLDRLNRLRSNANNNNENENVDMEKQQNEVNVKPERQIKEEKVKEEKVKEERVKSEYPGYTPPKYDMLPPDSDAKHSGGDLWSPPPFQSPPFGFLISPPPRSMPRSIPRSIPQLDKGSFSDRPSQRNKQSMVNVENRRPDSVSRKLNFSDKKVEEKEIAEQLDALVTKREKLYQDLATERSNSLKDQLQKALLMRKARLKEKATLKRMFKKELAQLVRKKGKKKDLQEIKEEQERIDKMSDDELSRYIDHYSEKLTRFINQYEQED